MSGRHANAIFWLMISCTGLAAALAEGNDQPSNDGDRLVAAVKVLRAASPQPAMAMTAQMATAAEARPTTPGGKLPQYQLGHLNRSALDAADPTKPGLRLLLALPNAPILVEADITINGKPYLMAREERVQDLLKFVADPEQHRDSQRTLKERATELLSNITQAAAEKITAGGSDDESSDEPASAEEKTTNSERGDLTEAAAVAEVPEYVEPASVYERIERYMAATEERPTSSELRWLLTDWIDGPPVLLLNDNYQRFRADQSPVFDVLDRDRNKIVSKEEIGLAVPSFNECDLNRDGLIEYGELADASKDPRDQSRHAGHGKLTFLLPNADSASGVYERLAHRYSKSPEDELSLPRFDPNKNGKFDSDEIEDLNGRTPDVRLRVSFYTLRPTRSQIELVAVAEEFSSVAFQPTVMSNSITLPVDGTTVDFSAVQSSHSDQISVGAVDDGYPMLPVVDPNGDGRFTIRELRSLRDKLIEFDTDQDGTLTEDETRSTIRVCFGLGPTAHAELSTLRNMVPPDAPPPKSGPDWFARMDKNKDGDLTREEFLGTDEHFNRADADDDKLVSPNEAEAYDLELKNE